MSVIWARVRFKPRVLIGEGSLYFEEFFFKKGGGASATNLWKIGLSFFFFFFYDKSSFDWKIGFKNRVLYFILFRKP